MYVQQSSVDQGMKQANVLHIIWSIEDPARKQNRVDGVVSRSRFKLSEDSPPPPTTSNSGSGSGSGSDDAVRIFLSIPIQLHNIAFESTPIVATIDISESSIETQP